MLGEIVAMRSEHAVVRRGAFRIGGEREIPDGLGAAIGREARGLRSAREVGMPPVAARTQREAPERELEAEALAALVHERELVSRLQIAGPREIRVDVACEALVAVAAKVRG